MVGELFAGEMDDRDRSRISIWTSGHFCCDMLLLSGNFYISPFLLNLPRSFW